MTEAPESLGFWEELKRRKVVRVATVYAVVGWLIIQVADTTFENFGIPPWAFRFVVITLLLGFPLSLILAWALEVTPTGIKRTQDATLSAQHEENVPGHKARRSWMATGFAAAVPTVLFGTIALVFYLQRGEVEGAPDATAPIAEKTIAVLPLMNLSMLPENAFFAGGLHEDILTNLSRVEGFQVVSRTSVMPYSQTGKSLRTIASELGADYVLEGSVRRIENHVRVTVQLIEAGNDLHLWANNYDRELRDEFAVQSAIAREITRALHLEMLPDSAGLTDDLPTTSVKAYDAYNESSNIFRAELESEDTLTRQRALLEEAVEADPDFAQAWAALNEVLDHTIRNINQNGWFLEPGEDPKPKLESLRTQSRRALDKAVSLAPDDLATLYALASDSEQEARESFQIERKKIIDRIIAEHPDDALAHYVLGWWYFQEGDRAAVEAFNRAIELDPFHAQIVDGSRIFFQITGNQEMVSKLFERLTQIAPEKGELTHLGQASGRIRLFNLRNQYLETLDPQLLDTYENLLFSEDLSFSSPSIGLFLTANYWEFRNEPEQIIAMQGQLELHPGADNWETMYFNLVAISAAEILQRSGEPESAQYLARKVLATEALPQASHPENMGTNHSAFAAACALLGDLECTRRWADKLIAERSESYNRWGLNGYLALFRVDPDRAARMILEEQQLNPQWWGMKFIAGFHLSMRDLLLHPDLMAYFRRDEQWGDYLAERVPEYAALRE